LSYREKKKFYVTIKNLLRIKNKVVFIIIKNDDINKKIESLGNCHLLIKK